MSKGNATDWNKLAFINFLPFADERKHRGKINTRVSGAQHDYLS